MSRRDIYHPIVKDALIREGWTITDDPYYFVDPTLSTDLGAERPFAAERELKRIVVEVKSFLEGSQVVELEKALGQYNIYTGLLKRYDPDRMLYLAVPVHAYKNIFQRQVGQMVMEEYHLRLIIYSLSAEEELIWKPR
jgi:hypothetical protein